jgi:hypothetical protein
MSDRFTFISIPDDAWMEADSKNTLTTTLQINETYFHLTAMRVLPGTPPEGLQRLADDPEGENSELDMLASIFQPDGPWDTLKIHGRDYLVFMDPFT